MNHDLACPKCPYPHIAGPCPIEWTRVRAEGGDTAVSPSRVTVRWVAWMLLAWMLVMGVIGSVSVLLEMTP